MIRLRKFLVSEEVIQKKYEWKNDSTIKYASFPHFSEEDETYSFEQVYKEITFRESHDNCLDYLIYDDDFLIGDCNIMIDPDHLFKKIEGTGWIGIVIGEEDYRGKGVGREVMNMLEKECINEGLNRIELGVFEFNERAIKLYEKLGYKKIGEIDNFTYAYGKWWKDIRYEKLMK